MVLRSERPVKDTAEVISSSSEKLGVFLAAVLIESGVQQAHAKRIAVSYVDRIESGAPHQPTIDLVKAISKESSDLESALTEDEIRTGCGIGAGVDDELRIHFGPEQGDELTLIDGTSVIIIAEPASKAKLIAAAAMLLRER